MSAFIIEESEQTPESRRPYYIMVAAGAFLLAVLIIFGLNRLRGGVILGDSKDIVGATVDGRTISIDQYPGKIIVVDFWATWCPPCVSQVPDMIALQADYAADVQVIGVSLDRDPQALTSFESARGINYPSIYSGAHGVARSFGVGPIPRVLIIDRDGSIKYSGYPTNLESRIDKLLEKKREETG